MALIEAAEAQYYCQEHVLQMLGGLQLDEEFLAEENLHANIQRKALSTSEGVTSNNMKVEASNLSSERERDRETETQTTRMGPLTFDLNPQLEEDEHIYLSTADDQAKLMQWHNQLSHLAFSKLKQLALNSKIPQRLFKVKLPTCVGYLFGAMTKVPWKGQETSSDHQVFVATKAGQ